MFVFIGGSLCLDFCNTEVIERGKSLDLLATNDDLKAWASEAGFALGSEPMAPGAIEEALRLREAIKHLLAARLDARAPDQNDIDVVNAYFMPAPENKALKYHEGSFQVVKKAANANLTALFTEIVQSLMELLVEQQYAIKKCANPNCILHFIDKSRAQKRKWCSMEICGNRLKVAGHHQRSKAG
jgi:predicted RNA-binding Zn ribbon-like protein